MACACTLPRPRQGDPLVLLHGRNTGTSGGIRSRAVAALPRHLSRPARSRLERRAAAQYDKESLAADVVNLLDALGLKVKLIGHDWGGWCGFIICLRHPERIERYLALGIPPPWGTLDLKAIVNLPRFAYQWLIASPIGYWLLRNPLASCASSSA